MLRIWLNERGKKLYPHLSNEWLLVYGYDPNSYSFLIWDDIMNKWINISYLHCEGRKD